MLTIFAVPKPFIGDIATIQRNALSSWSALADTQVVLVGDEEGVAGAAVDAGVEHLPRVALTEAGTPRLDDVLLRIEGVAREPLRCYLNADVILLDDFQAAVDAMSARSERFLMVGRTVDVEVTEPADLGDPAERVRLAARARDEGRSRGATAIDYFVFTPGLFDPVPPFAIGRARFDNWLVWQGRQNGVVADASAAVLAIHQRHGYGHLSGGQGEAHFGDEAERNLDLAGGKRRLFTIHDASHRLTPDLRLRRNPGSMLRVRESARKAAWKLRRR